MKKNYQRIIILVTLVILLCLYLLNSSLVIKSILDYTDLFLNKLFPVSFIFFIFSSLLLDYGLIELITTYLHINGSTIYIILMSLISGFPSGAKYTKDLLDKNLISPTTANYYITFTHFPNPLFILGSVNTIIKNNNLTILILISLILSNLITSILLKKGKIEKYKTITTSPQDFSKNLSKAIINAIKTIILIYGTSIFFYLIATMLNHYLTLSKYSYIFINGLFDLTKGVFSTTLISNEILKCLLIITFISIGGISIHMQVKSILTDTKIKYKYFLIGRLISTSFALSIFLLLLKIF